ncbi:MAG: exodeoxyribonuclease III [Saprospiraceae bacterium]|nr:exodeoxyribonuclease III [Saprospiraceae bacterium]
MSNSLSFISYNINGIRAGIRKGLLDWIQTGDFDIIGIQETKAQKEQVDIQALKDLGYHDYWFSAEKKGYSGVCIFSKLKPEKVVYGMGVEKFDKEGRVIRADFGDLTLLNCYFPSGTSGEIRQTAKYEFLAAMEDFIAKLKKERPNLIVQGDYNIAHTENDIHNPKTNKKTSGFLPQEREWLSKWFGELDFVDSFRYQHPEQTKYSWWTMRSKTARANNKGWRIDYQAVSNPIKSQILEADLINTAVHSDHCPCYLKISV